MKPRHRLTRLPPDTNIRSLTAISGFSSANCAEKPTFREVVRHSELAVMEAGGVEPPSEKRYAAEPTCLSQFGRTSLARGALSPAALRTSKKRGRLVRRISP